MALSQVQELKALVLTDIPLIIQVLEFSGRGLCIEASTYLGTPVLYLLYCPIYMFTAFQRYRTVPGHRFIRGPPWDAGHKVVHEKLQYTVTLSKHFPIASPS